MISYSVIRREVWEVHYRSRKQDRKNGKASVEKHGEIGETLRMKTYLHGPRPNVGSSASFRSRSGAPSRKECVVNGQLTEASNK